MRKLSMLTDLNAFDPLPALGAKIDKTPKPAAPDPLLAIHDFERTPHELSSHRPGPAGKGAAIGSDGAAVAGAKQPRPDLLGSFVPDGDQRYPGEGRSGNSHAGGHAAGDQADQGDAWGGQSVYAEIAAGYFRSVCEIKAREAGRTSAAGSALKATTANWTKGLSKEHLEKLYNKLYHLRSSPRARAQLADEYLAAHALAHP